MNMIYFIFKKICSILFIIVISSSLLLTTINIVSAQEDIEGEGIPEKSSGFISLNDPLNLPKDQPAIPYLLGKIIKAVLGIVGSLALVMFIYGGLIWMTSTGNEQRVQRGKNILIWAAIGLVVIFTSYALVHFIIFKGLGIEGQ